MNVTRSTCTICYTTGPTVLGRALVARSTRGLCAILLGDTDEALKAELALRFPEAVLDESRDTGLRQALADLGGFMDSPARGFDHPLDLAGTPFQLQVWQALRAIPVGGTASYTEIAARIGRPDAVRAVAGACAANRHAVVIPCHRVLRRGGALSGYRWGLERKRRLLELEALK